MVTSLSSPGVEVREIDLTGIVPSVSTTIGVLAGVFRWGPVDQRVLVDSEKDLVNRFYKPSNFNFETFFTGASFLAYGNKLYVTRVANTAGGSPSVSANVTATNATVLLATGNTDALESGMVVISSTGGGLAIGATIGSIVNSTAFVLTNSADAANSTVADAIQFQTNTAFSAIGNTGSVANLAYHTVANSFIFDGRDGTFDTDVQWIAKYPGELGNSLRVSVCGNASGFESTVNLASYGTHSTLSVETNSNTAVLRVSAAANTDAAANAVVVATQFNVTDLIEVGNTLIGFQYPKITALSAISNYGDVANTYAITTTVGSTTIGSNNTTGIANGMVLTSGPSGIIDLVVNNVINSTAFAVTSAPTVAATDLDVTISPTSAITLSFEDRFSLSTDYKFTSSNTSLQNIPRKWEFWNFIDVAPAQSDYNRSFGNNSINNDEIHIVITDADGKFTGVSGTVLETFESVSRAVDGKTLDGETNYYKKVINENSQYVYAVNDMSGAPSANAENLVNSTLDVVYYDLTLGKDGKDESNLELSAITSGYDLYASSEDVDVSLILQGKARGFSLANYLIDNIAQRRDPKDVFICISPQRGDVVNNTYNERDAIIAFRNNLRAGYDGSYATLDSGYKYMYDRYNDVNRWVPLNGDVAGLCVRTDRVAAPWFSPAGLNRGNIKNVIKLAYNPRNADRDVLYRAGVNSVVTFPGQGTVLWGDKTLLAKPSAFDRINVRRLFIVLEKAIAKAAKYTLFELNDEFTRLQFKNLVVPYLREVKGSRGVYDFEVVCDESNNPPTVVDRNEFVADIYIKPARSINYVQLNFVAVPTGIEFNEIIGRF